MTNYDLIILGAGPAALTAAVYALRYNLSILIVGGIPGGLMMETHKICNWPGEAVIAGYELSSKMSTQVQTLGGQISFGQITGFSKIEDGWQVNTEDGQTYQGKALIYSLGTNHKHLGLPAEDQFKGRGLSYCATCDAMFYKDKVTAVVGGGNSAMTAALYLSELCPTVYLISRGATLKGEVSWMKEVAAKTNIVHLSETKIVDLYGQERLEGLVLDKPYNDSERLAAEGLFVEVGLLPKTDLFQSAGGEVDGQQYIKVTASMATNLPGVFAAGDATNGSNGFRQIITAASEGAIAADAAYKYLRAR